MSVIDDTTHAHIKSPGANPPAGAGITSDGSVNVLATSDLFLVGGAGALAIGVQTVGVGVGADVGVATIRTLADIGDGVQVSADDSVIVQALASERGISLSVAGAFAVASMTATAVGVTAGVSVLNLTTDAHIGDNAVVSAQGNVMVQAQDTTELDVVTGNLTGGVAAAVGVAAGVSVITKSTESYIGSGAEITALGNRGFFLANTGAFTDGPMINDAQETSHTRDFQTQNVNASTDTIHIAGHGFNDGQEVFYSAAGQPIRGLSSGARYFVKKLDNDNLQLTEAPGSAAINLLFVAPADGGPAATGGHTLGSIVGVGLPSINNDEFDPTQILVRPGTNIELANRKGVVVSAVSSNRISTAGAAAGVAIGAAVQVAGAVDVHTIDTRSHIDAGARVNEDNSAAGIDQGVHVVAGRATRAWS